MRTKAGCFRVCVGGPWLLMYPEGVWYGDVSPERLDRILREHVLEDHPIEEWIVRTHPLCGGAKSL
jgi:(2Fe-2S) ferredoxin